MNRIFFPESAVRRASLLLITVLLILPGWVMGQSEEQQKPELIPIDVEHHDSTQVEASEAAMPLDEDGQPEAFILDRFEAQTTYRGFMDNLDFDQAVDVAQLALQLTEQEVGTFDMELVPILNDLGAALVQTARQAEAVGHFQRSIGIIEESEGIFAKELVQPTFGLGVSFQGMGQHDEAISSLQRAQHVTHRYSGVVNLDQIPIIQAIALSHMAQDKWNEAENLQLLAYKIHRRNYGKESIETLPAMFELANWYHDIQDYRQARLIYRRSLDILEEAGLDDSPEALPALRGIASAYMSGRGDTWDKGLALQRKITAIVDANAEQLGREEQVLAHLELGDWYIMLNAEKKAWKEYRYAWEMSQTSDSIERDWPSYLNQPQLIYPGGDLSVDFMGYGVVGKEVFYDFQFTIANSGRPESIEVIGTNMHGQTRTAAVQMFRLARFRPRIVDGATEETPGYRIRRIYPTVAPDDYGGTNLGGG